MMNFGPSPKHRPCPRRASDLLGSAAFAMQQATKTSWFIDAAILTMWSSNSPIHCLLTETLQGTQFFLKKLNYSIAIFISSILVIH